MKHINYYKILLMESMNEDIVNLNYDKFIDNALNYFKSIGKKVSSKDILERVLEDIGEEISEKDFNILFKKITGYKYGEKVKDIKFIIK